MIDRRNTSRLLLTVALALTTFGADAVFSQGRRSSSDRRIVVLDGREVVQGEVIVRYRSQGRIQRERAEFQAGSEPAEQLGRNGLQRMRSRNRSTRQMIETLRANPDIELVEPNYVIRANAIPNDPMLGSQYSLINSGQTVEGRPGTPGADIDAENAWNVSTGSRLNVVAILDTGIDYNHPDLAANVFSAPQQFSVTVGGTTVTCAAGTHGFNAITNTCETLDDNGHGTHVAGIVGAVGNNNRGVAGVNWTASVMSLKVLGADGTGTVAEAIKAIEWVIKAKAALGSAANVRVLNASWSGEAPSTALDEQIAAANSANMLFVASAGSDGTSNDSIPSYPSGSPNPNVISVAAVDHTGQLAGYSNWGAATVDIGAPGSSILSTYPNDQYAEQTGTSMAAPHVAGTAALVLAICPGLSATQLKQNLMNSVDPVASLSGKVVSNGRLNANSAVRSCQPAEVRVNGSLSPTTVSGGSSITVNVANGPGNPSDWVMMVPAGAPEGTWGAQYMYLNGTRTRPATGMTSANLQFTAPVSGGSFEFRFYLNDTFTRLATSPVVTVSTGSNPAPVLSSISPTSRSAGSGAFTLTVNGSGFVQGSVVRVNGSARTTSFVSSTTLTAAIPASDVASAGTLSISVFTPSPGGGTSGTANISVVAAAAPSLTVNGSSSAITVAGGSTITVNVANGPGNTADWVMMVAAGAPAGTWGPQYMYLSGSRTRPASGMTSASLQFTAPTSGGSFEFRFYQNDTFTLLATSPIVTVSGGSNPAPVLSSVSPTSRTEGSGAFTLTVTGSGFVQGSVVRVNGSSRTTTFVSSSTLTAAIPASDVTTAGTLAISVFSPAPGGGTSGNVNFSVTPASSTAPALRVNGSSSPITVQGGSTINVEVSNGPGNVADWVMMVAAGAAPGTWGPQYMYLSGTRTRPATGMTSATLQFTAPAAGGSYEFRFYQNDTFTLLATSPVVTVNGTTSSNPVPAVSSISPSTTTAGSAGFTLTVTGSGFVQGSVVRVNGSARTTTFVSSTSLTAAIPASDVASAGTLAISVSTPAPGGGTSGSVNLTVTSSTPTNSPSLRVNGSSNPITVAGGSTITVNVSNGPGNTADWVMMVPAGSAPGTWGTYMYLNGTRTRPAMGLTSANLQFTAPTAGGSFEFRFYQNDSFTLLATSPVVTVTTQSSTSGPSLAVNGSTGPVTVAAGSTIAVTVSNGPGNAADWVMMVPAGSAPETWGDYKYLSGTKTRPATGLTSATINFTAPAGGGTFEFRFYQNDTFVLLATSSPVTVNP